MDTPFVFISYSTANKVIADAICHELEEYKIMCWIAPRDITPGRTWASNIVQAIRDCSLMILVYSEDSNSSSQVANEVDKAFSSNKTIIPFLVDNTPMNDDFDYYLSRKHWLVAYPDYKEKLFPLVQTVGKFLGIDINKKEIVAVREIEPEEAEKDHATAKENNPIFDEALETAKLDIDDYKMDDAFNGLLDAALADYADAQFIMAQILAETSRLDSLGAESVSRVKRIADSGDAYAQAIMAYFCRISNDYEGMFRYAQMSAKQDDKYGLGALSLCYSFGYGVEKDFTNAHFYESEAIARGNIMIKHAVAKDLRFGWTVSKNLRRAYLQLKQCMEAGWPQSYAEAGEMFVEGDGIEPDFERGIELMQRAIELGYPEAYDNLGWAYMVDRTVCEFRSEEYCKEALKYLRKGALLGIPRCLNTMALIYRYGILGVEMDKSRAVRYYKQAAKKGDKFSLGELGEMYYYGEGVNEDNAEALKWIKKGVEKDHSKSLYLLGIVYLDGFNDEGEAKDCIKYFERSAIVLGGGCGESAAIKLYELFRTADLEQSVDLQQLKNKYVEKDWAPKDNVKAVEYLKRAAELGTTPDGIFRYGAVLATNDAYEGANEYEGIKYLRRAVEMGSGAAMALLGNILLEGKLVEKDEDAAMDLFKQAAQKDNPLGYLRMAKMQLANVSAPGDEAAKRDMANDGVKNIAKAAELECIGLDDYCEINPANFFAYLTQESYSQYMDMTTSLAEKGSMKAHLALGNLKIAEAKCADGGIGQAIYHYTMAANKGSNEAMALLTKIYLDDKSEGTEHYAHAYYWLLRNYKYQDEEYVAKKESMERIGHDFALAFEAAPNLNKLVEYEFWIFNNWCNQAYSSSSKIQLLEAMEFSSDAIEDNIPNRDYKDRKYLTKTAKTLIRDVRALRHGLSAKEINISFPELTEADFFPYLSLDLIIRLQKCLYYAWINIKEGRIVMDTDTQAKLQTLTLSYNDVNEVLDLIETIAKPVLQDLLLNIITISFYLTDYITSYDNFIGLNGYIDHLKDADYILPQEYALKAADLLYNGNDCIPRNYGLALKLYKPFYYLKGVAEKIKHCEKILDPGYADPAPVPAAKANTDEFDKLLDEFLNGNKDD